MAETAAPTYAQRLAAEALGTAFLLMSIIGPGILAMKTSGNNVALSILAITTAVFLTLAALIAIFMPISGAHFNPCVTLMVAWHGDLKWKEAPGYIGAQLLGGTVGTVLTNLMFELPAVTMSTTARTGGGQWLGEVIATFGLFTIIWGSARLKPEFVPVAVAGYVYGAIWFTSSTCFANPAVTFARMFTDTLTGIRPIDVVPFVACQLVGAMLATAFFQWLVPPHVAAFVEKVVPASAQDPARPRAASGPLRPLE